MCLVHPQAPGDAPGLAAGADSAARVQQNLSSTALNQQFHSKSNPLTPPTQRRKIRLISPSIYQSVTLICAVLSHCLFFEMSKY